MQKIAIISYFHYESSLCLAKSIAEQGVTVDYFAIVDMFHDKGTVPGIDYHKAPKHPGLIRLTSVNAPEICGYYEGLPVNLFLFRLVSFSRRLMLFNKIVFKIVLNKIKSAKYDAINIVGQWPWVEIIHNELKDENLTHTFHEVGSHFKGELSTPLMETVIRDKSKVILPSKSTLDRFRTLDKNCYCLSEYIPFGKFETLMLYRKPTELKIQFNNDSPIFLFYGFIKPYKGLDLLKRACEILNNRKVDFNLIVAGSGDDPTLPFYSTKKNCVVINRILYDDEMMYLNDISDVVLLPYKTASQSGIIPTSFIFGNPIIATKVGALVESIQDGKNGILVNAEDAVSFADAMQSLITDQNLMSLLKHGARQYGNGDEYDWHNIAKQTMSVLMNH